MAKVSKVLGLHLSPNQKGTSKVLLDKFAQGVIEAGSEYSMLSISNYSNLSGCVECGSCSKTGQCQISDDMEVFYQAFDENNKIVVASSLFFYDVPAQGKAVIDRSQAYWSRRYLLGQNQKGKEGAKGFLLAVGATKGKDLFTPVSLSVKYFFDALAFPKTFGTLFFKSLEGPSDISDEQFLQARAAGFEFGSFF
ncbi:MAG: flavodoxin family protein [Deltaproteobacteria bacterium]|jgi:multimeric flavodoxin WrbA|nr:flavodoxin family protein [Deltaproteobacteria bacterium]